LNYQNPELWHEAAKVLPLMSEEQLSLLEADIKRNGQQNPIVLLGGRVLDGRNRAIACANLGIEPKTKEWESSGGQSPEAWSLSQNVYRRNLTAAEEAVVFKESKQEPSTAIKARHLLKALLSCSDVELVSTIVSGLKERTMKQSDAMKMLKNPNEDVQEIHFIIRRLRPFLPLEGDGEENKLITALDEAASKGFVGSKEAKELVVWMLKEISKNFSMYAERISGD